jgi:hypothetical protein
MSFARSLEVAVTGMTCGLGAKKGGTREDAALESLD